MNKKDYIKAVSYINISQQAKERIISDSIKLNNKKVVYHMKYKKKIAVAALAAAMILGTAAFASSGLIASRYASSSSIPDYKTLPTAQECTHDVGYSPALIQTFENGYTYESGSIVKNNLKDEDGNSVEKFKSFCFRYSKDDDKFDLAIDKYSSYVQHNSDIVSNINGIDVYYNSYMNKLVPGDYELTDEDKKAEENGELVFSYGIDDIRISKVQNLYWDVNDMHYCITQIDGKLTQEDLIQIANEIINF